MAKPLPSVNTNTPFNNLTTVLAKLAGRFGLAIPRWGGQLALDVRELPLPRRELCPPILYPRIGTTALRRMRIEPMLYSLR